MSCSQPSGTTFLFFSCLALGCAEATPAPDNPSGSPSSAESSTDPHPDPGSARSEDVRRDSFGSEGLAPEQVRAVVLTRVGAFQACFEQGLAREPTLAGSVLISVLVAPDGTISGATAVYPPSEAAPGAQPPSQLATTLPDTVVIDCMLGVARTLRFPAKDKATSFSFPLVFKSKAITAPAPAR